MEITRAFYVAAYLISSRRFPHLYLSKRFKKSFLISTSTQLRLKLIDINHIGLLTLLLPKQNAHSNPLTRDPTALLKTLVGFTVLTLLITNVMYRLRNSKARVFSLRAYVVIATTIYIIWTEFMQYQKTTDNSPRESWTILGRVLKRYVNVQLAPPS